MRKRVCSPVGAVVLATCIWLVVCFAFAPLWLFYVDDWLNKLFAKLPSNWSNVLDPIVTTNLAEVCLPLALYLIVVRKYIPNRIVDSRTPSRIHKWVLLALLLAIYFLLVPTYIYQYDVSEHLTLGVTFVGVALTEEYAYRGVLTRVWRDQIGIISAIIVVAMFFAVSHWADIITQFHQGLFSKTWMLEVGNNFIFGVILGIIIWRSNSILWGAAIHFMDDWSPWQYGNPDRLMSFHIPLFGDNITLLLMGLLGAELLRLCTYSNHGLFLSDASAWRAK